jgi:hypothetical protein
MFVLDAQAPLTKRITTQGSELAVQSTRWPAVCLLPDKQVASMMPALGFDH